MRFHSIIFYKREEKEKWIRAKYESKQYLAPLQTKDITVGKVILEEILKMKKIFYI